MRVGRGRHPRVWFAAAPPGGPRSNPVSYYRAGLGPGTVERESGKSRWRAGQARIFFWRLLWRATPPHFWGNGKRDGQTPRLTKPGAAEAWLLDKLNTMQIARGSCRPGPLRGPLPAQAGRGCPSEARAGEGQFTN